MATIEAGESVHPDEKRSFINEYKIVRLKATDFPVYFSGSDLYNFGSGNPIFKGEINTSETGGFRIAATGDVMSLNWPVPDDMDLENDFEARVHWTGSAACTPTTDKVTWTLLYAIVRANDTTNLLSNTATAANTAIAQDTLLACYADHVTSWGKITATNFSSMRTDAVPPSLILRFQVSAAPGFTIANNELLFLGADLRYKRRFI